MRYLGGKMRIAKWIAENVARVADGSEIYIEPFFGSGAVFMQCGPMFRSCRVGDRHEDLVLMWNALLAGWDPPDWVSREEYNALRSAEPTALRGFVGYGASWGGKWFGGYTDRALDRHSMVYTPSFLSTARRSVLRTTHALVGAGVSVKCKDYAAWRVGSRSLVYCDPPYAGTYGYSATGEFDSARFWDTADEWVRRGACVVVSESRAPEGWSVLAERTRKHMMQVSVQMPQKLRHERLFIKS